MFKVGDLVLFRKGPYITPSYWGREAIVIESEIELEYNKSKIRYYDLEGNEHTDNIDNEYITKATKLHRAMK